jgi:hypothetical protein
MQVAQKLFMEVQFILFRIDGDSNGSHFKYIFTN